MNKHPFSLRPLVVHGGGETFAPTAHFLFAAIPDHQTNRYPTTSALPIGKVWCRVIEVNPPSMTSELTVKDEEFAAL